jgi:hypothetical protein
VNEDSKWRWVSVRLSLRKMLFFLQAFSPDRRAFLRRPRQQLILDLHADKRILILDMGKACRQQCNLLDVAGLCPHTAFFDPQGPAKGPLRSSLDVRALVLYT